MKCFGGLDSSETIREPVVDVIVRTGGGWHDKNLFQRSEMAGHLGVSFPAQSLLPPFLGQWNVSPGRRLLLICLVFVEELKL